jgi:hypothetical protein
MTENELSYKIIGTAIDLHKAIGQDVWSLFMRMLWPMIYVS